MNALDVKTSELAARTEEFENILPLHYTFSHFGIPFDCYIDHIESNDNIIIKLKANLGYLPYSAENNTKRVEMLKTLTPLIAKGRISIDHHCTLSMSESTSIGNDLSSQKIMEGVLYTLLDLRNCIRQVAPIITTK